jgi:hypothetical protein
MPSIQTSKDSIKFTSSIHKSTRSINLDSLCFQSQNANKKKDFQVFVEDIQNKFNLGTSNIVFPLIFYSSHNTFETLMEQTETILASLVQKKQLILSQNQ